MFVCESHQIWKQVIHHLKPSPGIRRILKNLPFKLYEQILGAHCSTGARIIMKQQHFFHHTRPGFLRQMAASNFVRIFSSSCTVNRGYVLTKYLLVIPFPTDNVIFAVSCDLSTGAHQCTLCYLVSSVK